MNKSRFRMAEWLLASILLLLLVRCIAPQQLATLVVMVTRITIGATVGYVLDRRASRHQRPDAPDVTPYERCAFNVRKAIIMGACIIASGMAV